MKISLYDHKMKSRPNFNEMLLLKVFLRRYSILPLLKARKAERHWLLVLMPIVGNSKRKTAQERNRWKVRVCM